MATIGVFGIVGWFGAGRGVAVTCVSDTSDGIGDFAEDGIIICERVVVGLRAGIVDWWGD